MHESDREHEIPASDSSSSFSALSPTCLLLQSCSLFAFGDGVPDRLLTRNGVGPWQLSHQSAPEDEQWDGAASTSRVGVWSVRSTIGISGIAKKKLVQGQTLHLMARDTLLQSPYGYREERCFFAPCRRLARLRNNLKLQAHE